MPLLPVPGILATARSVVWRNATGMDEIYMALSMADIFIAIGTSGHVYPAAGFVHEAKLHGAHTVELNLEPSQVGNEFAEKYYGPASRGARIC